jgi:hypothetical protein
MTDAINKCPYVVKKGTQDGKPTGICKFHDEHGYMCLLLTMDNLNDDDVTCFDLPADHIRIIRLYPRTEKKHGKN